MLERVITSGGEQVKKIWVAVLIATLLLPMVSLNTVGQEATLIISADKTTDVVEPGDVATFTLTIRSTYLIDVDANVFATGLEEGWSVLFSEEAFTIPTNDTYQITMDVQSPQIGGDTATFTVQAWVDGDRAFSDSQQFTTSTGTLAFITWESRLTGLHESQATAYEVDIASGDMFGVNVYGTVGTVYTPGFEITDSSEVPITDWTNFWNIYVCDVAGTPIGGTLTITTGSNTDGSGFYIALEPLPGVDAGHWVKIKAKMTYDSTTKETLTQKYAVTSIGAGTYGVDVYLATGEVDGKTADPGVTVTYNFHVENTGTIAENIRIYIVGHDTTLPTEWSIKLIDVDTGATLIDGDGNIGETTVYVYQDVSPGQSNRINLRLEVTPDAGITIADTMRVVAHAQVQLKIHDSEEFGSRQIQEPLTLPDYFWWVVAIFVVVVITVGLTVGRVKKKGEKIE